MSDVYSILLAVGLLLTGAVFGSGLAVFVMRETVSSLRAQIVERERMINIHTRREAKLLAAFSEKIGMVSDPDVEAPRTHSRSQKELRKIYDQRRREEERDRAVGSYDPVALAAAKGAFDD